MEWITEDYCSYEVSKLLNEKGFNGMCDTVIGRDGTKYDIKLYDYVDEEITSCPTHQMAMKWLREVHKQHIMPKYDFCCNYYSVKIYNETLEQCNNSVILAGFKTYEASIEAAIKYCLENLI